MRKTCWVALCAAGVALAQTGAASAPPPQAPAFDVASVKALAGTPGGRDGGGGRGMGMGRVFGGRGAVQVTPVSVTMRNTTLKNAIRWAYGVTEYQVSGPDWMNSARFDIAAKAAAPATQEQLQLMTQNLLADRFKLALHRQTKEFQVYVLVPGKNGTKLQESKGEGEASIQPQPDRMSVNIQHTPVSAMIDLLTPILGAPVLDMTGMKAKYDITVNIAKYLGDVQAGGGGAPPDPLSLIESALEGELGLKLEARKMPLDLLIVDRVEKIPTEN